MTVVITQCRLSSTRLPRKALKDLGGKSVLEWVLNSMKKVKADAYYLATDEESLPELELVAKRCGWQVFAGPKEDVLERFCLLIEKVNADVVVRATADNPFLFYEAAQALLDEYEAENKKSKVDYITWSGLPHGSGVEIFNAHSLLNAKDNTKSPYDHEHVGPALYKHTDLFNCVFKNSPARWNYPELRTTIDTHADYVRAQLIYRHVKKSLFEAQADARNVPDSSLEPFTTGSFTTEQIVSAFENPEIKNMILLVPCVKKGKGTGHLMRCLRIASKTGATVYIPQNADLAEKDSIIQSAYNYGLEPWQITEKLPSPGEYGVIFTDVFSLNRVQASVLYSIAPVVALDEGSEYTEYCDYLFNVIPPLSDKDEVNLFDSRYISLPSKRRTEPRPKNAAEIKTVLISIGGEDPLSFAIPASMAFARLGKKVTTVKKGLSSSTSLIPDNLTDNLKFSEPFENLMDQLYKYDLVVTHYGLTAYEACAAGCAVLLVGTSELHIALANKYGFVCVNDFNMPLTELNQILENTPALYKYEESEIPLIKSQKLSSFVTKLTSAKRMACPVCANSSFVVKNKLDPVVARTAERTFRRCSNCKTLYMSFNLSKDMNYDKNYFAEQYKNQYGKTYLEDFDSIKKQCVRRVGIINSLFANPRSSSVLDIGCAYGPFLSAAFDSGFQVFGTDIAEDAVNYVRQNLKFPVACAAFPDFNPSEEFGVSTFDAVTMWFVIEHFKNLGQVLQNVSAILKKGGIFAFSTPSASGVSAKFNRKSFFEQSPSDHYTLWEFGVTSEVLKRFGFEVVRIVSTGHHPERFPIFKKYGWKKGSLMYRMLSLFSRLFKLGDTFEVYCRKIR